jgi:hypothetical protein
MTPDVRLLRAGGVALVLGGLLMGVASIDADSGHTNVDGPVAEASTTTDTTSEHTGATTLTADGDTTDASSVSTASSYIAGTTATDQDGVPRSTTTTATVSSTTTAAGTAPTSLGPESDTRLVEAAETAGFSVLAPADTAWALVSVDAARTDQRTYVATSYQRGPDFLTISQERATSYPEVPNTTPVTVRGVDGGLLDLGSVVVVRWIEGDTSLTLSTNLRKGVALTVIEALRTIP